MKWFVTGDTHGGNGVLERLHALREEEPANTALIILGDAGLNFYCNKTDEKLKAKIEATGYTIYCVRGNHEARPQDIEDMTVDIDVRVQGLVFYEPQFPHIRYLMDGNTYYFGDYSALVVGGAYSVDKYWRLGRYHNGFSHFLGWWPNEQLSTEEMAAIDATIPDNTHFNMVLTHTCPISWEPKDLFLDCIDQSEVDKSMEIWLEALKNRISFDVWLFGHYHDNRLVRPGVEMYYKDVELLDNIFDRLGEEPKWWMRCDPHYEEER